MGVKESYLFAVLGGQRYGLPVGQVSEVVRACRLVRVPQAPPALLGALFLRGTALPVIDIRPRLGWPVAPLSPAQCFIVGQVGGRQGALLADEVRGLAEIDPGDGKMPDVPVPEYVVATVADEAGGAALLLDLAKVLTTPEATEIARAMESLPDHASTG